jgi:hypothetical protein
MGSQLYDNNNNNNNNDNSSGRGAGDRARRHGHTGWRLAICARPREGGESFTCDRVRGPSHTHTHTHGVVRDDSTRLALQSRPGRCRIESRQQQQQHHHPGTRSFHHVAQRPPGGESRTWSSCQPATRGSPALLLLTNIEHLFCRNTHIHIHKHSGRPSHYSPLPLTPFFASWGLERLRCPAGRAPTCLYRTYQDLICSNNVIIESSRLMPFSLAFPIRSKHPTSLLGP